MPAVAGHRDVFVCFSKARPGEAQVAIALKHELEQLGLYAFEYEDWHWVADQVPGDEPDVDRATLRHMLTASSVVVLISPHQGAASPGVQTEIAILRECASPVILLHWSPHGWRSPDDHPDLARLNIVWNHEGRSAGDGGVAQNTCAHSARQLAVASWLACQIHWANTQHPQTAARLLAMLPDEPQDALLNFRLQRPAVEPGDWPDPVDFDQLAAAIVAQAAADALRDYVHQWRNGTDLLAEDLAREAQFSLAQPVQALHAALEALCEHALRRLPDLSALPIAAIRRRGLTYVRLNQPAQALPLLQQALLQAPREEQFELHQAIAFAQREYDPQAAIASFTQAIACAPTPELACALTYSRAVLRAALPDEHGNAIADFTFVAANGWNAALRHSALCGRARLNSAAQRYDDAIADYSQILADAGATPRTAVSSWMDRGAVYRMLGRYADAVADWTQAIQAADAEPRQRFRTLEARAQTLEKLGDFAAAADDYEAMARFADIAPRYRDELEQHVAQLRGARRRDRPRTRKHDD